MKVAALSDALRLEPNEFHPGFFQQFSFLFESVKKRSHLFWSVFMLLMVFFYLIDRRGDFFFQPVVGSGKFLLCGKHFPVMKLKYGGNGNTQKPYTTDLRHDYHDSVDS